MPRLFIGLELNEQLLEETEILRGGLPHARWQRDDQLHITLAFIGDVHGGLAREISQELGRIQFTPFEVKLSGVGYFGKEDQPKILYAGLESPTAVQHLHDKITNALRRIDVPVDNRKFKPHCTLARFRKGTKLHIGAWLGANAAFLSSALKVRHFTLFQSHLTSEGSYYEPLENYDGEFYDYAVPSE